MSADVWSDVSDTDVGTLPSHRRKTVYERLNDSAQWVDQYGKAWELGRMDPSHRANLLAFLRRNAETYHFTYVAWLLMFLSEPNGDQAALDLDRDVEGEMTVSSRVWLERQPLVERLRGYVALDEGRDPATGDRGYAAAVDSPRCELQPGTCHDYDDEESLVDYEHECCGQCESMRAMINDAAGAESDGPVRRFARELIEAATGGALYG